jgi:hypothetical protein
MIKALSLALHQKRSPSELALLGCDWLHTAQPVQRFFPNSTNELLMMLLPPASDIDSSGEPDVAFLQRILDKLAQPGCPPGLACYTRVETDRHHLGIPLFAFLPELI